MNQADLEYIVGLVTQQVMAAMNQGSSAQAPQYEGMSKILVVGPEHAPIPEDLCEDSVAFGLADYCTHKNILRYDRVIITDLTTTQLADIAMARVSDDVTDAVITALLNGIDTYMLESALSFRKMAGKGSTALYNLLESYARTLQVFGIKMAGIRPKQQPLPEAKPPKFKAPAIVVPKGNAMPNANRLISEVEAAELIKAGGPVHLAANAIITPLARDMFAQARVDVIQDR
jgi:ethanolamine utilization protein